MKGIKAQGEDILDERLHRLLGRNNVQSGAESYGFHRIHVRKKRKAMRKEESATRYLN